MLWGRGPWGGSTGKATRSGQRTAKPLFAGNSHIGVQTGQLASCPFVSTWTSLRECVLCEQLLLGSSFLKEPCLPLRAHLQTQLSQGWLKKSGEEISIFLLPPLKSMLDSWCGLESTKCSAGSANPWGGKGRGSVAEPATAAWISLLCALFLPTSPGQASGRRPAQGNHQETEALALRGDVETRSMELQAVVSTRC